MSRPVRTQAPPAGPEPALELPKFATHRLANGLRVEIARTTTTPDVAVRLVLGAGAGATVPERAGLASLTCDLLEEGADGRSAREMAEWIDGLGAAFDARATYDDALLSMHAMNDQLDEVLEFLAAVTRRPDFAPAEVSRRRDMRLDQLRRRGDEPARVAGDALDAAVFGGHPYGAPLVGTVESVERLEAADLAGFWARGARPDTACLVICGDVEPATVLAAVEREFGEWAVPPEAPPPAAPAPPAEAARAGEILLFDRPASRQTELRIGGVGIARGEAGEEAALVMNAILGGLFSSRVNLKLREERGWTYGARTALLRRRRPGPFLLRTAVATEATAGAFTELLAEFERLRDEPPEPAELELAANALTRSLPLQFQTASQLAGRRAEMVTYELPDDYWERFPERIEAVDSAEVRDAARRLLAPDGLVLLAVGAVADFAAELGELGPVHVSPGDRRT
ncbi:MAG TPA: pitrilysin family protein [Gemmatimonadota bacterium]|nr:pitrilysin family protein [Gemmatimonadota bacterium]